MTNTLYAAEAGAPGQMLSNANFSVSDSKRKGRNPSKQSQWDACRLKIEAKLPQILVSVNFKHP